MTTATATPTTATATPLVSFPQFTPEEVRAFMDGDCWELARVMGNKYGLNVVIALMGNGYGPGGTLIHAAVRLQDGRIADIEGIWEEANWQERWRNTEREHERHLFYTMECSPLEYEIWLVSDDYRGYENEDRLMDFTLESFDYKDHERNDNFCYPEYAKKAKKYAKVIMKEALQKQ